MAVCYLYPLNLYNIYFNNGNSLATLWTIYIPPREEKKIKPDIKHSIAK